MAIADNTPALQEILAAVNALPEAGGGTNIVPVTYIRDGVTNWTKEYEAGEIVMLTDPGDVIANNVTVADDSSVEIPALYKAALTQNWYGSYQAAMDADFAEGGMYAKRFKIPADISGLSGGYHKVGFVYRLFDGSVRTLHQELRVDIKPVSSGQAPQMVSHNGPSLLVDYYAIKENADKSTTDFRNHIASATLEADQGGDYVRITTNGGDPYVAVIPMQSTKVKVSKYLAMRYRTNYQNKGQFFIGSGTRWTGGTDEVFFTNNADGEWHDVIVDVSSKLTNNEVGYLRLDMFAGAAPSGSYFDVQYVAFFETEADAINHTQSVMLNESYEAFYVNDEIYDGMNYGAVDEKLDAINNTITFPSGTAHDSITLQGWVCYSIPTEDFGYYIDDDTNIVYGQYGMDGSGVVMKIVAPKSGAVITETTE